MVSLCFSVAGILLEFNSAAPMQPRIGPGEAEHFRRLTCGFGSRMKKGKRPDIRIRVFPVRRLPSLTGWRPVFTAKTADAQVNWRLFARGGSYRYQFSFEQRRYLVETDSAFRRIKSYVYCPARSALEWDPAGLMHHLVQVLLINYLSLSGKGVFLHACAIREVDGRGLLFIGDSNAGKSTLARFWSRRRGVAVLNDDRAIVTFERGRFLLHRGPWSGEFYAYFGQRTRPAVLSRMYLIGHAPAHQLSACPVTEVFPALYSQTLLVYWEKKALHNSSVLLGRMAAQVPCARLGFAKDASVVDYLRKRA